MKDGRLFMTRQNLINEVDRLYELMYSNEHGDEAEKILIRYGANESDEDPNEGYMNTMTDDQLRKTIVEFRRILFKSVQKYIDDYVNGYADGASQDYIDGFLDACKLINREYNINLHNI